jgi:hypothetical protein
MLNGYTEIFTEHGITIFKNTFGKGGESVTPLIEKDLEMFGA